MQGDGVKYICRRAICARKAPSYQRPGKGKEWRMMLGGFKIEGIGEVGAETNGLNILCKTMSSSKREERRRGMRGLRKEEKVSNSFCGRELGNQLGKNKRTAMLLWRSS